MFNLSDTICAICTPVGVGSIAAIRISGSESWEIASKIFYHVIARSETTKQSHNALRKEIALSGLRLPRNDAFTHMYALHGYIKDEGKIIDEVIVLPYKSPKSYTGENVIEIFCHGGNQIASMILDLCLKNSVRRANSGEFTFRAFINGRIDLTQAEAINEIIHAQTQKAVYATSENMLGSLKEKIKIFREKLFSLITEVESAIEFPLDVPQVERNKISFELLKILEELDLLVESSKEGQILREGVKVSIIGAPNVGKSSLLNKLLETDRAIVTSEPGTTRDTIEEKIIVDGYPIVLIDTAGIRKKSQNESEKLGIERSQIALEKSDIALLVFDLTRGKDKEADALSNLLDGKPRIVVGNKIDLISNKEQNNVDVVISAKYGTNVDQLKKLIVEKIKLLTLSPNSYLLTPIYINQRQKELLIQCSSHIKFANDSLAKNVPDDLISDELKKAVSKLDEVSGVKTNEDVISNIFKKFCIGK